MVIDKLAWIFIQDKKVLGTISKGRDKYYIPGGKRELYENDVEALTREIKEELSVTIDTNTLKYYGIFKAQADGKDDGITVKISCYMADYKGILKPDSEIEKIVWMTSSDINKASKVVQLVIEDLYKKGMIN